MKSASVTQARDARKSQSQKLVQTLNENDSDVALDTSSNTKSSEIVNKRSDSEHKQDKKEAQNEESYLELCRLSKRRSDVEKLLKVVIDIREDFDDSLIVVNTAVLDIISLKRLLDCEAKWEHDVLHCTQENASSDTEERLLNEIRNELRFCKIAFDVRQTETESAFKCYQMIAEAHDVHDVYDVWNERADEENENAEFVFWFNTKMNADNINKVIKHQHLHT